MSGTERNELDRRQWLAGWVRGVVLGGLAAATATLVGRGQVAGCGCAARACAACGDFSVCRLPEAAAARDRLKREGSD